MTTSILCISLSSSNQVALTCVVHSARESALGNFPWSGVIFELPLELKMAKFSGGNDDF